MENYPLLTLDILQEIVSDAVALCNGIISVGLIGSFSRGEQVHSSDVDLLINIDDTVKFSYVLDTFGEYIEYILDYQFNKRLDIIRYEYVIEKSRNSPTSLIRWYDQEGFKNMLKEVIWIYER